MSFYEKSLEYNKLIIKRSKVKIEFEDCLMNLELLDDFITILLKSSIISYNLYIKPIVTLIKYYENLSIEKYFEYEKLNDKIKLFEVIEL